MQQKETKTNVNFVDKYTFDKYEKKKKYLQHFYLISHANGIIVLDNI